MYSPTRLKVIDWYITGLRRLHEHRCKLSAVESILSTCSTVVIISKWLRLTSGSIVIASCHDEYSDNVWLKSFEVRAWTGSASADLEMSMPSELLPLVVSQ